MRFGAWSWSALVLGAAWCGTQAASAATISTLGSHADTYLRDATARGAFVFMDVRGAAIDFRSYLRFDLSSLGPNAIIQDASLKLTVSGGASRNDAVVAARIAAYGLNNVVGNTPQNWNEATFVPASKGTEDVTTLTGVTDLDDNVAGISEVINVAGSAAAGTTVTYSGAPLVAFLQSRVDDGGLSTFILSNDDATDRGFGFATKENATEAWRPMLTITYLVPEPTSLALALAAMAVGTCLCRRS